MVPFILGACSYYFLPFVKQDAVSIVQAWRPVDFPSMNAYIRMRIVLESEDDPFLIMGLERDSLDRRLFAIRKRDGLHIVAASIWCEKDDIHIKNRIMKHLMEWFETRHPDLVLVPDISLEG